LTWHNGRLCNNALAFRMTRNAGVAPPAASQRGVRSTTYAKGCGSHRPTYGGDSNFQGNRAARLDFWHSGGAQQANFLVCRRREVSCPHCDNQSPTPTVPRGERSPQADEQLDANSCTAVCTERGCRVESGVFEPMQFWKKDRGFHDSLCEAPVLVIRT
jgi:hypothetical protein